MMKKFLVTYYEVYKGTYEIEAQNEEEAKEELMFRLENRLEEVPEECDDSGIEKVEEVEEFEWEHLRRIM